MMIIDEGKEKSIEFPVVHISQDLPQEIVFSLTAIPVTFSGRVVHGITGEPVAGAVVMLDFGSSNKTLGSITAEEWATMRRGGLDNGSPLHDVYHYKSAQFTDSLGYYSFSILPHQNFYGIKAVEENFMATARYMGDRWYRDKQIWDKDIQMKPIALYPAAKVRMNLVGEKGVKGLGGLYRLGWRIDEATAPDWAEDHLRSHPQVEQSLQLRDGRSVRMNQPQVFHVLAGVNLSFSVNTRGDNYPSFPLYGSYFLGQGEVLDLGEVERIEAEEIVVQVVDGGGYPVEGVPVRVLKGDTWSVPVSTGAEGYAHFKVFPGSSGVVGVSISGGEDGKRLARFDLSIEDPSSIVYTITLSEDDLIQLFED